MTIHVYADRDSCSRRMAPPSLACERCGGTGLGYHITPGTEDDYIPDYNECYCKAECHEGQLRRYLEGDEGSFADWVAARRAEGCEVIEHPWETP